MKESNANYVLYKDVRPHHPLCLKYFIHQVIYDDKCVQFPCIENNHLANDDCKEQLQQFIQDVITETSLGMGFWAKKEQHEETKT